MTVITSWDENSGGLLTAVKPADMSNPEEVRTVLQVMHGTFQAIAAKHGATYDVTGLQGNFNALVTGRMIANVYYAKWKGAAKELCMGAAFDWGTYGLTPGGILIKGDYTEDVALPRNSLRELILAKPFERYFPDESLAQIFERLSLRNMQLNNDVMYRFGEVNVDNTTMMRQLMANGSIIFKDLDSGLFDFKRFPNHLMDSFPMIIREEPIVWDGVEDKNNFLVCWNEGDHEMRFIVTHAQATGVGKSRIDVNAWDNGKLPVKPIQECVIDSSLLAIKRGVENRKWAEKKAVQYPSSLIPLFEAHPEIVDALYPSKGIISLQTAEPSSTFCPPPLEMHLTVRGKVNLVDGMRKAGGEIRFYGDEPMVPVETPLSKVRGISAGLVLQ